MGDNEKRVRGETADRDWWRGRGVARGDRPRQLSPVKLCEDRKNYSPAELGELLGVTASTVRDWIRTGKLRAGKKPKGYLVLGADANAFLNSHKEAAAG